MRTVASSPTPRRIRAGVRRGRLAASLSIAFVLAGTLGAAHADDSTIPDGGTSTLPEYTGKPGYDTPVRMVAPPQNPYMAPNPFSNVHNDAWLTDTARILGPSGRDLVRTSNRLLEARRDPQSTFFVCGTLTFDSQGRILSPCMGPGEDSLVMIDPVTLEVLAYKQLPLSSSELTAYGSAYMYLDKKDRAMMTVGDEVWAYVATGESGADGFRKVGTYDFSAVVPADSAIQSVMPDWKGRLWAMLQGAGAVAVLDPKSEKVHAVQLKGQITNSFAVNDTSAYVVTTKRMYRLDAGKSGKPRITWSRTYKNTGETKPGQKSAGSGTSPTLLAGGRFVAINDNAKQMHVVVYRTAADLPKNTSRKVCSVAVFDKGKGASENSLVAWKRSTIIQNTYGYELEKGTWNSPPTAPGLARIDVKRGGTKCRKVWQNDSVLVPSVLGKLSTPAGQFYTMTRQDDSNGLPTYFWTTFDADTGEVAWRQMAGTGSQWDSYVPALAIGPEGTLYTGLYGGIASLRDLPRPQR